MAINVFVKSGGAQLDEISATADKVLSGYTYNDSDGEVQTGTMPNKGTINANVNVNEEYGNTGGYYSSIKITGPILSGDAETSNVLADKTFYSNSGIKQTGTMINRGIINETIGVDESYSGLEGYYSSINIIGPTLTGTATPEVVRAGYTFYSNNGIKQTGTMATKSPSATTVPRDNRITRSQVSRIISRSWDAISLVCASDCIMRMMLLRLYGSSAVDGSSIRSTSGCIARTVAIAAIRFSPPEIL